MQAAGSQSDLHKVTTVVGRSFIWVLKVSLPKYSSGCLATALYVALPSVGPPLHGFAQLTQLRAKDCLRSGLHHHPRKSVGEVADRVGPDYITVSRQMAELESLGPIVR
jgi:hypothetical protein